jgi:hypothetical protein
VIPVELDEDAEKDLLNYLTREHDQALEDRRHLDDREWPASVRQYNSRLTREDAIGDTDSNLDMGLSFKYMRVDFAQTIGPLYRNPGPFWVVKPAPAKPSLDTSPYQRIVDFIDDVDDSLVKDEIIYRTAQVMGYAPVKIGWTVETESVLEWVDVEDPQITPAPANAIAVEAVQSHGSTGADPSMSLEPQPGADAPS